LIHARDLATEYVTRRRSPALPDHPPGSASAGSWPYLTPASCAGAPRTSGQSVHIWRTSGSFRCPARLHVRWRPGGPVSLRWRRARSAGCAQLRWAEELMAQFVQSPDARDRGALLTFSSTLRQPWDLAG